MNIYINIYLFNIDAIMNLNFHQKKKKKKKKLIKQFKVLLMIKIF